MALKNTRGKIGLAKSFIYFLFNIFVIYVIYVFGKIIKFPKFYLE